MYPVEEKPVSSQKVGANPCGRPGGQAHPQVPFGEGLPLPQIIETVQKPDPKEVRL